MSTAKEEILARIRAAIVPNTRTLTESARDYIQTGSLGLAQRLDLFAERLHDYDAHVFRVAERDRASQIALVLEQRGKKRIAIPPDLPRAFLPVGPTWIEDHNLTYDDLDRTDGALTMCTVAIAQTGTIIVQSGDGQGRRALTLIPDYLLCIVHANQIVETVPEAIRWLVPRATRPITTISGPSATSDIEMTRIKGVHGPRVLDVLLVM